VTTCHTTSHPWSRDGASTRRLPWIAIWLAIVGAVLAAAVACSSNSTNDAAASSSTTTRRSAATAAPRPSEGCHSTGATPATVGATTQSLAVRGLTRSYFEEIPRGYMGTKPVPLVVDFHGYAEGAQLQTTLSGFAPLAEAQGF